MALHKLRQTWNDYFKASTLYKIDLAVHAIDPAWPIVTPQPHSVASTSAASQSNHTTTTAMHTRNSKVHVNPHFFQKNSVANGQQQLVLYLNLIAYPSYFLLYYYCVHNSELNIIKYTIDNHFRVLNKFFFFVVLALFNSLL